MTFKPTAKMIWFLLLGVLFLAGLVEPSTREAQGLCFRLLFPLNDKTFVQGQPPGCILYTIPNVQFSESYQSELRRQSDRSADDFALAAATKDWSSMKIPAAAVWANHPLLEWAVFRYSWLCYLVDQTNAQYADSALELIRLAQTANRTNGALWLAEALVSYDAQHDEAGMSALRVAAEKNNWTSKDENDFHYLSSLYQKAGLSALDAAIEANIARADFSTLNIQGRIKEHLQRLMTEAVRATNDSRFSELFNLLVELRKADWPARNVNLQNAFRFFGPDDELFETMKSRLNLKMEPSDDYIKQREIREQVFRDYLALQADQAMVSRFWGQADMAQTEKKLRKEIREDFLYRRTMAGVMGTDISGALGAVFLYLFVIAILEELPFAWLRKMGGTQGKWPREWKFWIGVLAMLAIGLVLGRNFFLTLGLSSEVGLRTIDSQNALSPATDSLLISIVLSCVLFAFQFSAWKFVKKSTPPWTMASIFACGYLIAIAAMAYWRHQALEAVSLGIG